MVKIKKLIDVTYKALIQIPKRSYVDMKGNFKNTLTEKQNVVNSQMLKAEIPINDLKKFRIEKKIQIFNNLIKSLEPNEKESKTIKKIQKTIEKCEDLKSTLLEKIENKSLTSKNSKKNDNIDVKINKIISKLVKYQEIEDSKLVKFIKSNPEILKNEKFIQNISDKGKEVILEKPIEDVYKPEETYEDLIDEYILMDQINEAGGLKKIIENSMKAAIKSIENTYEKKLKEIERIKKNEGSKEGNSTDNLSKKLESSKLLNEKIINSKNELKLFLSEDFNLEYKSLFNSNSIYNQYQKLKGETSDLDKELESLGTSEIDLEKKQRIEDRLKDIEKEFSLTETKLISSIKNLFPDIKFNEKTSEQKTDKKTRFESFYGSWQNMKDPKAQKGFLSYVRSMIIMQLITGIGYYYNKEIGEFLTKEIIKPSHDVLESTSKLIHEALSTNKKYENLKSTFKGHETSINNLIEGINKLPLIDTKERLIPQRKNELNDLLKKAENLSEDYMLFTLGLPKEITKENFNEIFSGIKQKHESIQNELRILNNELQTLSTGYQDRDRLKKMYETSAKLIDGFKSKVSKDFPENISTYIKKSDRQLLEIKEIDHEELLADNKELTERIEKFQQDCRNIEMLENLHKLQTTHSEKAKEIINELGKKNLKFRDNASLNDMKKEAQKISDEYMKTTTKDNDFKDLKNQVNSMKKLEKNLIELSKKESVIDA